MLYRIIILLAVLLAVPAFGAEAEGKDGGPRPPKPGMVIKFVLDHATELVLTDDQKAKIEALVKDHEARKGDEPKKEGPPPEGRPEGKMERRRGGPLMDILTEEQNAKLRELLKANRPERSEPKKDRPDEKF